jgi:hypothetical protein
VVTGAQVEPVARVSPPASDVSSPIVKSGSAQGERSPAIDAFDPFQFQFRFPQAAEFHSAPAPGLLSGSLPVPGNKPRVAQTAEFAVCGSSMTLAA